MREFMSLAGEISVWVGSSHTTAHSGDRPLLGFCARTQTISVGSKAVFGGACGGTSAMTHDTRNPPCRFRPDSEVTRR